jgi:hypothetical protein
MVSLFGRLGALLDSVAPKITIAFSALSVRCWNQAPTEYHILKIGHELIV